MKRKYNFFTKLYHSVIIDDVYIHTMAQPLYKSFIYIVLLSLLLTLPQFLTTVFFVSNEISQFTEQVESPQFPDFTVSEGNLQTDIDSFYQFTLDEFMFVIDGNDTFTLNDMIVHGNGLLFDSTSAILIRKGLPPSIFDYRLFFDDFDKSTLLLYLKILKPLSLVMLFFFLFLITLFVSTFYILVSMLFLNTKRIVHQVTIKPKQLFILATYCSSMPLIAYNLINSLGRIQNLISINATSLFSLLVLFILLSAYTNKVIQLIKKLMNF